MSHVKNRLFELIRGDPTPLFELEETIYRILYYTILYYTILYYTILYYTMLYYYSIASV